MGNMISGMDPKLVKMAMKRMGISQENVDASKVIIETKDKNIVINNPEVSRVDMQGNISFQVSGAISEEEKEFKPSEEDIELIMEKTKAKKKEIIEILKKNNGDIAETILELSK